MTPKIPNNVVSTSFGTVHLFPEDLGFEHGGAKLDSCPWRHLSSVRNWCEPPPGKPNIKTGLILVLVYSRFVIFEFFGKLSCDFGI